MPKFITRQDVTPTSGSWETIDVTSYVGTDSGSVAGVLLKVVNESLTEYTLGLRKYGSSGTITKVLEDKSWQQFAIGVDSSDRFEANISNTAVKIYLEGYFLTSEAVFFDDWETHDKTPGTTGSLQLVDISSDTGTDTAKVAIFICVNNNASTGDADVSTQIYNDTTDIKGLVNAGDIRCFWTGVDSSERCNVLAGTSDIKIYLAGYLKANVTALSSLISYDITNANYRSFYDLDLSPNVPAGSNGVLLIGGDLGGTSTELMYGARKNGDTIDPYTGLGWDTSNGMYGLIEIDSNRVIEVKSETSAVLMWIFGYTNEPSNDYSISTAHEDSGISDVPTVQIATTDLSISMNTTIKKMRVTIV